MQWTIELLATGKTTKDKIPFALRQLLQTKTRLALFGCGWFLRDGVYLLAAIVTTVRTNGMGQAHLLAVWADHQIRGFHGEMTAAAVAASFREFSFG